MPGPPPCLATGCLVALLVLPAGASAVRYRIDTFAGGGSPDAADPAFVGDGLPATLGVLNHPSGLARDPYGSIYVADHDHGRVRRVRTTRGRRVLATVAGSGERGVGGDEGPALAARMVLPTGLASTPDGQLLVVDAGNDVAGNTVRRIDRQGVIHAFAGLGDAPPGGGGDGGPAVAARLSTPLRAAVARTGEVYVVELNGHRVRLVRPDGLIRTFAGRGLPGDAGDEGPAPDALLRNPAGIALASDGTLYIADFGNHRIRAVTRDGIIHAVAGTGVQTGSLDGEGGDVRDDRNDGPAATATFSKPTGLALDGRALLVADQGNHIVRRIAPDRGGRPGPGSLVTTIVGNGVAGFAGDGGDALAASLTIPTDVLPLGRGRLLVADRGNHRVRIVVPAKRLCARSCNDGNPCTLDTCDPRAGCRHAAEPDADGDLVCDALDNCPLMPNRAQRDADGDRTGDACEM
jgi:sugar lactone lactonase YvrE